MELPDTCDGWQAPAPLPTFRNRPFGDGARLAPSPARKRNWIHPATREVATDDAGRAGLSAAAHGQRSVRVSPGRCRMLAGSGWVNP